MSIKELNTNNINKLSKEIKIKLDPKNFCILPFSHLSTTTTGEIRLCCRSKSISNIKKKSILKTWNSQELNAIRDQFLNGERPSQCLNCWRLEDNKLTSLREGQNCARAYNYKDQLVQYVKMKKISLPTIELKLSNKCNLKCKMCSPAASNRWAKDWKKVKPIYNSDYSHWIDKVMNDFDEKGDLNLFMKNSDFIDELKKMSTSLNLIDFAGGEPLIDPIHYEVLRNIIEHGKSKETTLRYSTNLSVLSYEKFSILELWSQFKNIELTVSIDGDEVINEYIRTGSNSQKLKENINEIKKLEQVTSIKGTTTISALNAPFIYETANYILGELKIPWHTSRVTSPSFLDARIWPQRFKEKFIEQAKHINPDKFLLSENSLVQVKRHIKDFCLWMNDEPSEINSMQSFLKFIQKFELSDQYFDTINSKYKDKNLPKINKEFSL